MGVAIMQRFDLYTQYMYAWSCFTSLGILLCSKLTYYAFLKFIVATLNTTEISVSVAATYYCSLAGSLASVHVF